MKITTTKSSEWVVKAGPLHLRKQDSTVTTVEGDAGRTTKVPDERPKKLR